MESPLTMTTKRQFGSSLVENTCKYLPNYLYTTALYTSCLGYLNRLTTEMLTFTHHHGIQVELGPELPQPLRLHCMLGVSDNAILLIGGALGAWPLDGSDNWFQH